MKKRINRCLNIVFDETASNASRVFNLHLLLAILPGFYLYTTIRHWFKKKKVPTKVEPCPCPNPTPTFDYVNLYPTQFRDRIPTYNDPEFSEPLLRTDFRITEHIGGVVYGVYMSKDGLVYSRMKKLNVK